MKPEEGDDGDDFGPGCDEMGGPTVSQKRTLSWEEFQHEDALVVWQKRAHQHRLEGCQECLNGGCISRAVREMVHTVKSGGTP